MSYAYFACIFTIFVVLGLLLLFESLDPVEVLASRASARARLAWSRLRLRLEGMRRSGPWSWRVALAR